MSKSWLVWSRGRGAPWARDPPSPEGGRQQRVLDAAFVDDTVLILTAPSPRTLDGAVDILLRTVQGYLSRAESRDNLELKQI